MTDDPIIYHFHTLTKRAPYLLSALCALACLWVTFHARTTTLAFVSLAFALAPWGSWSIGASAST